MKQEETAIGFGSDQEKEMNPERVIEAHTRLQEFIAEQIANATFPDYVPIGFNTWKKLCSMRDEIVFSASPEKMANGYPNLEEYGQRVSQWIWDKHSFMGKDNQRQLNEAGKLLIHFLNTELGIVAQPKKKSQEELRIEQTMTDIHAEIRHRVKKGQITSPDSDAVMDEIKRTAPEDRKYEKELYEWIRKLTIDRKPGVPLESLKKSAPSEFQTDLTYLLQQLSGHLKFEDVGELIRNRRLEWRREKIIREMSPAKKKPEMKQEIITNTPPEDSSEEISREVMNVLHQGNYPIVALKLKPLDEFSLLERKIKTAYAKKEGVRETDVFVEDASTLGSLKTSARFSQNLSKTERQGEPIPLEDKLVEEETISLVRISIKGKEAKWRSCEKKKDGTWEMKPYPGKVFTEKETPALKLLNLDDPMTDNHLKKLGIKNPKSFKETIRSRFILKPEAIHIAELNKELVIRLTTTRKGKTEYLWFDLMPLLAA